MKAKYSRIAPRSKKGLAMLRQYAKQRKTYLLEFPTCPRCLGAAVEIHHMAGRIGKLLLDESKWMPICHECHQWVTTHPTQAIAEGWSLSRFTPRST